MATESKRTKGNPLRAIFQQKCPACLEGDFFKHPHGYRLKEIGDYHDHCPNCGQRFNLEPGFYFGAAYVSYALNVALVVAASVATYVLMEETEPHHYVIAVVSTILLLVPATFRMSRMIWATMFIPFGGEKKQFKKTSTTDQAQAQD